METIVKVTEYALTMTEKFVSSTKGAFINYERGGWVFWGGDLKIFYTEKVGPEMPPAHWGVDLKYLTSENIKGSFFTN